MLLVHGIAVDDEDDEGTMWMFFLFCLLFLFACVCGVVYVSEGMSPYVVSFALVCWYFYRVLCATTTTSV